MSNQSCKLPLAAKRAILKTLTDLRTILCKDEEGFFRLEEMTNLPTSADVIQSAWANGYIQIDRHGHIHLLTTTRIEMNWDHKSLRRKSEDHLRKASSIGEIVKLSIELGVQE